jgi:hypothetical protein
MKSHDGMLGRDPAMLGVSGYDRQPHDQYFTPAWCSAALLSKVRLRGGVWEPAAGRGDMVRVLESAGLTQAI